LLSHDLFEGIFARAGLASDVEVVDEFPARYDVAAKRQHRWTRGDWQLLPWVVSRKSGSYPIPGVGLGKILDNLRRSLVAPFLLLTLGLSWLLPMPSAIVGSLFVLGVIAIPAFLPTAFSVLPRRAGIRVRSHLGTLVAELKLSAMQTVLSIALLADHAWQMGDAIMRTLVRLYGTRRHLLQWTTAAQSTGSPRLALFGFYRQMSAGTALGLAMTAGAAILTPS
jgi:cyclic beta-1,2-glucan synthetase